MEHRWSIRKPIQGRVALTLLPWEKIRANLSDISLGGLAVTGLHRPLPINTVVTLSFSLERDGRVSYHRLNAQVAHCANNHVGFLFVEPENDTLTVLRDMLYSPASQLAASIAGQPYMA